MTFYEIEFPLAALNADEVEAALFGLGASSITLIDGGDEPVLEPGVGEIRLWSDTRVTRVVSQRPRHLSYRRRRNPQTRRFVPPRPTT